MMRSKWAIVALVLAIWALSASFFASYYWLQYSDLSQQVSGIRILVNIRVDYGNGTRTFYNDTKAFTGESVLTVTKRVATVETTSSSVGIYVTSIDGKAASGDYGWTYWPWNSTGNSWSLPPLVGAAVYQIVANESTFLWYYQNSFNPPP